MTWEQPNPRAALAPSAGMPVEDWPVAYGYLRAADADDPMVIGALVETLSRLCRTHRLRLVNVYCDPAEHDALLDRPALIAVLEALAHPDAVALTVPSLDHLSTDERTRDDLLRSVSRTGARLLTAPTGGLHERSRDRAPAHVKTRFQPCARAAQVGETGA